MREPRKPRTVMAMDRFPANEQPAAGELLLQGALLSLYVSLRTSVWAVGRLERVAAPLISASPEP